MALKVDGLTPARARVLAAVVHYWNEYGFAPSYADICVYTGTAARSGVLEVVGRLEREGYVERAPGVARSIRATSDGHKALRVWGDR